MLRLAMGYAKYAVYVDDGICLVILLVTVHNIRMQWPVSILHSVINQQRVVRSMH